MNQKKVAIIVLVLLLVSVIACWGLCHHTNGFKDWSFKQDNKPPAEGINPPLEDGDNESDIIYKHIEKTIIENETYGTFELPKHYIKIQNVGAVFAEGTNVSYLVEDVINLYKAIGIEEYNPDTAKIGYKSGDYFNYAVYGEASGIDGINVLRNDIINYRPNHSPSEAIGVELLILDIENNQSTPAVFFAYCKAGEYYNAESNMTLYAPEIIISNKGCPLTAGIYEKLMLDPATKITNVYKDGAETPNLPSIDEPKEVIRTVIETEKNGTFEVAGDCKNLKITSAQNIVYANKTELSYMLSEAVNLVNAINGTSYTTDNVKIGFVGNDNVNSVGITHIQIAEIDGQKIYEFDTSNKVNFYQDSALKKELQKEANLQIVFVDVENQKYYKFANNVYVKDYLFKTADGETKLLPELIVSDSNIPLTESIFNEIMADQTTKITYVYKG